MELKVTQFSFQKHKDSEEKRAQQAQRICRLIQNRLFHTCLTALITCNESKMMSKTFSWHVRYDKSEFCHCKQKSDKSAVSARQAHFNNPVQQAQLMTH